MNAAVTKKSPPTLVCFPWARIYAPSVEGVSFTPYLADDSTVSADVHRVMSGYQNYPAESLRDDFRGLGCTLEQIEKEAYAAQRRFGRQHRAVFGR
jgi:hypothetical protein